MDVIKVARAIGQQVFETRENVLVKRVWYDDDYGYVVIVEGPGCSETSDVRGWRKQDKK